MCYIASIYKLKDDASKEIGEKIGKRISKEQWRNSHGSALVERKPNGNLKVTREMDLPTSKIIRAVKRNPVTHLHFRLATEGTKDESNIHFWRKDDWLFAHNGYVRGLTTKNGDSDSKTLFDIMERKGILGERIIPKSLKKVLQDTSLTGRFVLVNKRTRNSYFVGDWKAYLLNRDYLVLTSATTDKLNAGTISAWGLDFKKKVPDIKVRQRELDGLFVINDDYKRFRWLKRYFSFTSSYSYGSNYHANRYCREEEKKKKKDKWYDKCDYIGKDEWDNMTKEEKVARIWEQELAIDEQAIKDYEQKYKRNRTLL